MREKSVSNIIKQLQHVKARLDSKWTHDNRVQRLGMHGHCYKRRLVIARHVCRLLAAASRPVGHCRDLNRCPSANVACGFLQCGKAAMWQSLCVVCGLWLEQGLEMATDLEKS